MFSGNKNKQPKTSQNNKVAVSAIALFVVSLSVMLFFVNQKGENIGGANVLHEETSSNEGSFKFLSIDPLYEAYLKSFEEAVFVTDFEGKLEHTNKKFDKLIENNIENLRGKKFSDFVNAKDLSELLKTYTKIIQSGKILTAVGPFRIISNEEEKLILLTGIPYKNGEGKVEKIIFVVKDLTDKVEELKENPKAKDVEIKSWIDRLYPKIKDIDGSDTKLLVDKIGYLKR